MASFFRPAQQPASQYQGALLTAPASPVVRAGSLVQRTSLELSGCQRMGSNPAPGCSAARVGAGGCRVTCDSHYALLTARARRRPVVSDAARTQRGPGRPRSRPAPVPPCVDACGTRSSATGTGSACRARLAVSPLEGGPLVCLSGLSVLVGEGPLCRGGSWPSRRLAYGLQYRQSQETPRFYAALGHLCWTCLPHGCSAGP